MTTILLLLPGLVLPALAQVAQAAGSPISVIEDDKALTVRWPTGEGKRAEHAQVRFDLRPGQALLSELSLLASTGKRLPLLTDMEPLFLVTEGKRTLSAAKKWMVFFDKTNKGPRSTFQLKLSETKRDFRVVKQAGRVSVFVGPVSGGGFSGEWSFTFYPGTALIHAAAEVRTEKNAKAILYDAGLCASEPGWDRIAWLDNHDQWQKSPGTGDATAMAVRQRSVIAECGPGRVAVFPPPHRFFYPLDYSNNLKFAWHGRGLKGTEAPAGFGIRQEPEGDRRWVPWFNAPPGAVHKLDVFYYLHRGSSEETLAQVRRYTRGDQFKPLEGYRTFTSHYHVEHTLDLLKRRADTKNPTRAVPTLDWISRSWRYQTQKPPTDWHARDFDDHAWKEGRPPFGKKGTPAIKVKTEWTGSDIWLRRYFSLGELPGDKLRLRLFHDEDTEVYLNGVPAVKVRGFVKSHVLLELSQEARKALRVGENTIAIHCWNDGGGQGLDANLLVMNDQADQPVPALPADLVEPDFVKVFRDMGVDIVHLAEFHNGRTPRLPAPERLHQLHVLHNECSRLSSDDFLLLPGEEPNVHFGGHWISFFPQPVYWVLNRSGEKPFTEIHPTYGRVYHVGSAEDVWRLLQEENGLAWTAHARIKGSTGYPDKYREQGFFKSPQFLGAAWKSLPADLSRNRLGWRVLDLLDDMNNWGEPKFSLGEVDVFKIDPSHELYAHMNINYVKLDTVPHFDDGWQALLTALRQGQFFVTTGEVLIPDFQVNGAGSGEILTIDPGNAVELKANLEWTFPLSFAEVVSGDGSNVYRERIDLNSTSGFGTLNLDYKLDLTGRTWVRLEAWDVAANGAFTQPVFLRASP